MLSELKYNNKLIWLLKRNNVVITNHENIFFCVQDKYSICMCNINQATYEMQKQETIKTSIENEMVFLSFLPRS